MPYGRQEARLYHTCSICCRNYLQARVCLRDGHQLRRNPFAAVAVFGSVAEGKHPTACQSEQKLCHSFVSCTGEGSRVAAKICKACCSNVGCDSTLARRILRCHGVVADECTTVSSNPQRRSILREKHSHAPIQKHIRDLSGQHARTADVPLQNSSFSKPQPPTWSTRRQEAHWGHMQESEV
jgi:hypothetical protein